MYLGDRPGEPGPHGQNGKPTNLGVITLEALISDWPDKLLGTHPVNWFPRRSSRVRLARLPNSGGISPVNWFPRRSSRVRLARLPNAAGISPPNRFEERSSRVRLARLPKSAGR